MRKLWSETLDFLVTKALECGNKWKFYFLSLHCGQPGSPPQVCLVELAMRAAILEETRREVRSLRGHCIPGSSVTKVKRFIRSHTFLGVYPGSSTSQLFHLGWYLTSLCHCKSENNKITYFRGRNES